MKKITVNFNGKTYSFTYYGTVIESKLLFFVITDDAEASRMLIENHYFISLDIQQDPPQYLFNGILGTEEEASFKSTIANAILEEHFRAEALLN